MNLNHLAGLKLIRKTRRSRLLRFGQVCTAEANTRAKHDGAHDAASHGENVLPMRPTSTQGYAMNCQGARAPRPLCRAPRGTLSGSFSAGAPKRAGGALALPRVPFEVCCEAGTLLDRF